MNLLLRRLDRFGPRRIVHLLILVVWTEKVNENSARNNLLHFGVPDNQASSWISKRTTWREIGTGTDSDELNVTHTTSLCHNGSGSRCRWKCIWQEEIKTRSRLCRNWTNLGSNSTKTTTKSDRYFESETKNTSRFSCSRTRFMMVWSWASWQRFSWCRAGKRNLIKIA